MTLQSKIKVDIILTTVFLFSFIALLGFIYAMCDTPLEEVKVLHFIIQCLFPVILLLAYFNIHDPYILILFVVLDILLYSFVFIKIFSRTLANTKKYEPFTLTHITAHVIPSIILIRLLYQIVTSK